MEDLEDECRNQRPSGDLQFSGTCEMHRTRAQDAQRLDLKADSYFAQPRFSAFSVPKSLVDSSSFDTAITGGEAFAESNSAVPIANSEEIGSLSPELDALKSEASVERTNTTPELQETSRSSMGNQVTYNSEDAAPPEDIVPLSQAFLRPIMPNDEDSLLRLLEVVPQNIMEKFLKARRDSSPDTYSTPSSSFTDASTHACGHPGCTKTFARHCELK